jgi:hypothetical protein
LMVKISRWTNRQVKVSEMILELDGKKMRMYETIDEAGIRENSELVLRTETKKRDEDEDEDDIFRGGGGGESDSERSDAWYESEYEFEYESEYEFEYESEYEFEYEDPFSSSEGSDDDD